MAGISPEVKFGDLPCGDPARPAEELPLGRQNSLRRRHRRPDSIGFLERGELMSRRLLPCESKALGYFGNGGINRTWATASESEGLLLWVSNAA